MGESKETVERVKDTQLSLSDRKSVETEDKVGN